MNIHLITGEVLTDIQQFRLHLDREISIYEYWDSLNSAIIEKFVKNGFDEDSTAFRKRILESEFNTKMINIYKTDDIDCDYPIMINYKHIVYIDGLKPELEED